MHNDYAMPNTKQTKDERKLKHAIARMAGVPYKEARRFRDWNWHPLRGALEHHICQKGGTNEDIEAISGLCETGYQMFKGITKTEVKNV